MTAAALEHINVTVTDTEEIAGLLCRLFDWRIRWRGPGIDGGYTIHVGSEHAYLAVYSMNSPQTSRIARHAQIGGLNHVGVVVDDLDAMEKRVIAEGFTLDHDIFVFRPPVENEWDDASVTCSRIAFP